VRIRPAEVLWALLGQPPSSGFDVCDTLSRTSGRRCTPARLLPALVRLEDAGLVQVDRSGDPYTYALTSAGIAAAQQGGPGRSDPAMLVMLDLVGFTRFTEQHGDGAAHEQATRLSRLAASAVRPASGEVVKSLGDGVLLRLPPHTDPLPLVRGLAHALATSDHPWLVHGGAHAGTPIRHAGDLFGRDVNLVARLCDRAGAGELLMTAADGAEALQVEGFDEPVRVQRVAL
jgi:class 3 adenylate cyclase